MVELTYTYIYTYIAVCCEIVIYTDMLDLKLFKLTQYFLKYV